MKDKAITALAYLVAVLCIPVLAVEWAVLVICNGVRRILR